jgi:hypothetical protein
VVFSTSHQPPSQPPIPAARPPLKSLTPPSESAKAGDTQGGLREASRRRVPVSSDERAILYSGDDRLGGACYKSVNRAWCARDPSMTMWNDVTRVCALSTFQSDLHPVVRGAIPQQLELELESAT